VSLCEALLPAASVTVNVMVYSTFFGFSGGFVSSTVLLPLALLPLTDGDTLSTSVPELVRVSVIVTSLS
jgi:hypothetical protein